MCGIYEVLGHCLLSNKRMASCKAFRLVRELALGGVLTEQEKRAVLSGSVLIQVAAQEPKLATSAFAQM
jgi:hypothetical protein